MKSILLTLIISLLIPSLVFGEEDSVGPKSEEKKEVKAEKRQSRYKYFYKDRSHTTRETFKHIGIAYGVSWIVYPLTQPSTVKDEASFDNYKNNFGKIVFDKDEPFWNLLIHPLSGSQLYLFYRANGYEMIDSMALSFVSSTLFEFTIEIFTEPASVQDLYQTPVLGSIIGLGFEHASLYLLNTGNPFARFFGHLMNPWSLFGFFENKVIVTPAFDQKAKPMGLKVAWEF